MRRLIIITLLFISLCTVSAYASSSYGDWAKNSIENAIECNIISADVNRNYYQPITRLEIAQLISSAYYNNRNSFDITKKNFFVDVSDSSVDLVSELGIMNGYGDGTFLPNATTSRQEMSKILLTYQSVVTKKPITFTSDNLCNFIDYEDLSDWAKPYVISAVKSGLLNGYEDGSFGGLKPVSWQEAIVMIERVAKFSKNNVIADTLSNSFDLNITQNENTAMISWNKLYDDVYTLTITEQRLSRYEGDIPASKPIVLNFFNEDHYAFETNPNKLYTIKISSKNYYFVKEIYTSKKYFDDMDQIYSTYPQSKEEAEPLMVDITVPVWKLNCSSKIASSATFKVHYAIADKVKLVFEDIFAGVEKFPIKDVGGYSWRGGRSEHNGGTAIDINSNENYCIYNNGTTIGSYWKPFEDPYSITPYGDVIRAFEKYGFTWGGDSWSNPKDYMHFSYLGT